MLKLYTSAFTPSCDVLLWQLAWKSEIGGSRVLEANWSALEPRKHEAFDCQSKAGATLGGYYFAECLLRCRALASRARITERSNIRGGLIKSGNTRFGFTKPFPIRVYAAEHTVTHTDSCDAHIVYNRDRG